MICHIIFDGPLLNYRSAELVLVYADVSNGLLHVRIAVALIVYKPAYPHLVSEQRHKAVSTKGLAIVVDAILKGITRDTIIKILKSKGYNVVERPISIHEVFDASENGSLKEIFGTGTAAVIAPVSGVKWKNKELTLQPDNYVVAKVAKETINGLRDLSIPDTFGWVVKANSTQISR